MGGTVTGMAGVPASSGGNWLNWLGPADSWDLGGDEVGGSRDEDVMQMVMIRSTVSSRCGYDGRQLVNGNATQCCVVSVLRNLPRPKATAVQSLVFRNATSSILVVRAQKLEGYFWVVVCVW